MNARTSDLSPTIALLALALAWTGLAANAGVIPVGTNSWNFPGDGLWQEGAKWSLTASPTIFDPATLITNAGSKIVTINSATSAGNLIISNLTLRGIGADINTLQLTNAPASTLRIHKYFTLGTNAALIVSNSTFQVDGLGGGSNLIDGAVTLLRGRLIVTNTYIGTVPGPGGTMTTAGGTNQVTGRLNVGQVASATGTVWVTGGQLVATNSMTSIGIVGIGSVTVSNGTMLCGQVDIGSFAGGQGTLTVAGGTNQYLGQAIITGGFPASSVWVTGGRLFSTNAVLTVGSSALGQFTITNGTFVGYGVFIGDSSGGLGTFTASGGTTIISNIFKVGGTANSSGAVWINGGLFQVDYLTSEIGSAGKGRLTVSNGFFKAQEVFLGRSGTAAGTLTIAGGTNNIDDSLILGSFNCLSTGIVNVVAGNLHVTNATATAVLDVRSGTLTFSGGLLAADKLVITNVCGRFIHTGGTLMTGTNIVTAAFDADGDGIPNSFDFDPFNPADAGADPDGDGFTTLQEFQAGTSPSNSASFFGITAIVNTNIDVRVTWMTGTGKTNALERTAGTAGNFSTNGFTTIFTATNTAAGTTNYLDVGAATNFPARYYRVRLVP